MPIMAKIGRTARQLRESLGLTQREAARQLGVSVVHLCNIENEHASPSTELLDRFRDLWGVDLYILAWCQHGDVEKLPPAIRKSARALAESWKKSLGAVVGR